MKFSTIINGKVVTQEGAARVNTKKLDEAMDLAYELHTHWQNALNLPFAAPEYRPTLAIHKTSKNN
jgi:hypothetical protein